MSRVPTKSPPKRPLQDLSVPKSPPQSRLNVESSTPHLGESSKRRKLSHDSDDVHLAPVPSLKSSTPLPNLPLLYHLALSAHRASSRHLQQSFIPPYIDTTPSPTYPPITIPDLYTSSHKPFTHDPEAPKKSLDLLILALDLLKTGLRISEISDREVAYLGYEYGIIGLKVYMTALRAEEEVSHAKAKGKEVAGRGGVESKVIMADMLEVVSRAVSFVGETEGAANELVGGCVQDPESENQETAIGGT